MHTQRHDHKDYTQILTFAPLYIQTPSQSHIHQVRSIIKVYCCPAIEVSPTPPILFSFFYPFPFLPSNSFFINLIPIHLPPFFVFWFSLIWLSSPLLSSLWQMKAEISSSLWSGWAWHTPTGVVVGGGEEGRQGFRRKARRWEELWGAREGGGRVRRGFNREDVRTCGRENMGEGWEGEGRSGLRSEPKWCHSAFTMATCGNAFSNPPGPTKCRQGEELHP